MIFPRYPRKPNPETEAAFAQEGQMETPGPQEGAAELRANHELPSPTAGDIEDQIAQLTREKEEERRARVRLQADFENYKKRVERERAEDRVRITAALIETLLPVLDGFERALAVHGDPAYEEHRRGFELIYKQLFDALARMGLVRVRALGQPFDPHLHQAVERVAMASVPEGTVVEELAPGYLVRDRLLRPAMVRVAYSPATESAGTND